MVSTRSPGSIILERALSIVVLPEPVPPEMTMLKRLAPAILSAVHIFWLIAPHWQSMSSVIGLAENLRIEIRSEEQTSELQSLMRNSYAVFFLQKKKLQNYRN